MQVEGIYDDGAGCDQILLLFSLHRHLSCCYLQMPRGLDQSDAPTKLRLPATGATTPAY